MRDKDEILREIGVLGEEYDNLPSYHAHRQLLLEKINMLRWVLGQPPVKVHPGGTIIS